MREDTRHHLKAGELCYDAGEVTVSWRPTLRALGRPRGQHVMLPTPGQPYKRYGLGAVNYHTGATVVLCRRRTRRQAVAERLQARVDQPPTGMSAVAWDHADAHAEEAVEAVVRAAERARAMQRSAELWAQRDAVRRVLLPRAGGCQGLLKKGHPRCSKNPRPLGMIPARAQVFSVTQPSAFPGADTIRP
jgi:hypothetical protein